jgi:hypothetical protein
VIEIERKFLVIAVALIAVAMLATPVLAKSPKWIPVTLTRAGMYAGPGEYWITEGGTRHGRDFTYGFTTYIITGPGINLVGTSSSTFDANINLKNGKGTWQFESTIVFPGGTFEGQIWYGGTWVINGDQPTPVGADLVQRGVWHGTGAYRGWTFKLEMDAAHVTEAYMLIP